MRSILRLCAVAVLTVGVGSCSKSDTKPKVVIGFIGKSQANAVFQAAHAGARAAAKEAAAKYGVEVDLIIQTPPSEDAQKQAEAIDGLVRANAAGIAISCSAANIVTPAINRAVAAGAAVACFDSDAPDSKRMCYYGTDDRDCGMRVMDELAKAMGEKGTIAILAGNPSAPNLQARVAGVREKLKSYPNMKELNDGKGVFYHPETPSDAAETVRTAQNTNPQIEGWAMIGGWPLFTKGALNWPPGRVKVVSVDALPAQLPYVKDGYVEVLLGQDCYGWGRRSVELLLDKIVLHKDPPAARIIDPLTPVTKQNADEYGKRWEAWLGQ
ncbi:MAG: substrate-binding domain-containing protein [Tepidisphaeraceae bacterium]